MRFILLLLTSSIFCFFGGCQKKLEPTQKGKPVVLVSLSPYDTFVKKIAGNTLDVKTAVPSNFNSHLFEPTPKQIEGFEKSALFFGIDEPFEKYLLHSLRSYNPSIIYIDLGEGFNRKEAAAHAYCSHTTHSHEEKDRHYWTNPIIALKQGEKIKQTLIKHFPGDKKIFEINFAEFKKECLSLDHSLQALLKDSSNAAIVSSHPSLGYFCERYSLEELAIECEGKTPLPKDLQKIISLAKNHRILCVFGYEQFDNKGALAMSKHLHLPLHIININSPNYFENMENIGKIISQSAL